MTLLAPYFVITLCAAIYFTDLYLKERRGMGPGNRLPKWVSASLVFIAAAVVWPFLALAVLFVEARKLFKKGK